MTSHSSIKTLAYAQSLAFFSSSIDPFLLVLPVVFSSIKFYVLNSTTKDGISSV